MSRSWFVDQIGPSRVAANGSASVGIRRKLLNIITGGTTVDNPGKRRIDLTVPPAAWAEYSAATLLFAGEWMPVSTAIVLADLVRVEASDPGALLVGLDSGSDPTKPVKFVANIGLVAFTIQPPAAPVAGKQYFSGDPVTLAPGSTIRVVWDTISRVYRVRGTSAVAPVSDHVLFDGTTLVLGTSPISNPL